MTCGSKMPDGPLTCDRPANHEGDHGGNVPLGMAGGSRAYWPNRSVFIQGEGWVDPGVDPPDGDELSTQAGRTSPVTIHPLQEITADVPATPVPEGPWTLWVCPKPECGWATVDEWVDAECDRSIKHGICIPVEVDRSSLIEQAREEIKRLRGLVEGRNRELRFFPDSGALNDATEFAFIDGRAFVQAHKHEEVVDGHLDRLATTEARLAEAISEEQRAWEGIDTARAEGFEEGKSHVIDQARSQSAALVEALRDALSAITTARLSTIGPTKVYTPQISTTQVDKWRSALTSYEGAPTPSSDEEGKS